MTDRVCQSTGLALVAGPVSGYRIASVTYGPLSPPERSASEDRGSWSRWDTPGRTLYLAEDAETAFRECLAWARMTATHKKILSKLARLWSVSASEVMKFIHEDFTKLGHMQPGHLPYAWREERRMHVINVPADQGTWVDMDRAETFDALSRETCTLFDKYPDLDLVDRSVVYSNDREITARISDWLRDLTLDDGSEIAGIRYTSRIGHGLCWAYWMRRTDLGLREMIDVDAGKPITLDDPAFKKVTESWEIKAW